MGGKRGVSGRQTLLAIFLFSFFVTVTLIMSDNARVLDNPEPVNQARPTLQCVPLNDVTIRIVGRAITGGGGAAAGAAADGMDVDVDAT